MTTRFTDRKRRGNSASMFVLMMPAVIGSVAMGVDWGAVAVARLQVQAAADAAAVAATTDMDNISVASSRASAYAAAMRINGVLPTVTEISYGVWDSDSKTFFPSNTNPDKNAVRVRTQAVLPMYFAWILGVNQVTIRAESGAGPAVIPRRAPDHVMALDVTCSMSNAEVSYEVAAAVELLECVKERSDPSSRGGVTVYTGLDFPVVYDLIEYGLDTYDDLRDETEAIRKCGIGSMPPCSTNTNQAAGYYSALEILDRADSTRPEEVGQVIIIMSDGEPNAANICTNTFYNMENNNTVLFPLQAKCAALGNGGPPYYTQIQPNDNSNGRNNNYGTMQTWALAARATADSLGIDTYTVYYGPSGSSGNKGSNYMRDKIRVGEGTHSRVNSNGSNPSLAVREVFKDICVEFTGGTAGMLW